MSTKPNYLEMSDDEVMNMSSPPEDATPAEMPEDPAESPSQAVAEEATGGERNVGEDGATGPNDGGEAAGGTGEGGEDAGDETGAPAGDEATAGQTHSASDPHADTPVQADPAKPQGEPALQEPAGPKPLSAYTAEEKAAAFDELMAPFKANGKEIQLASLEELKTLRSMGANYTKKMQALQPAMRVVKMLENNNLLDENKLAFLIDLDKKEPLAIQKLLADSQFDPMAADKDQAANYIPGSHQVSDLELQFQQVLDEVIETPEGSALIVDVQQWDPESKQALFQQPDTLRTLNQQRELGLYQQITSEVDRLRTLGQIGPEIPFLQAYRAVGDMLHSQGRLVPKQAPQAAQKQPVEVRVAAPASAPANSRAKAAAPTRATSSSTKVETNYLELPDEEFLKSMNGRV